VFLLPRIAPSASGGLAKRLSCVADMLSLDISALCWRIWRRRGWAARLLWPFSLVFALIISVRRVILMRLARSWRAPVPLVIVGNLNLGGSGKTPIVLALAQILHAAGHKPAVISRGYGARGLRQEAHAVQLSDTAWKVGDEALMLARALAQYGIPVWIHPRRVCCARTLLSVHTQTTVLLSDDGLQHYALARDLQRDIEIVVMDPRLLGNGWLLPAGPLREFMRRRRDFTLWTGLAPERQEANSFFIPLVLSPTVWQLNHPQVVRDLSSFSRLSPNSLLAAAGIGYPEKFFSALREQGLRFEVLALPDHFAFSRNPFVHHDAEAILITEKDAVKCSHIDDSRIWVLPVAAEIPQSLIQQLLTRLGSGYPALSS
jgi:tetraacyldisaccharide 4'-kinase